MANKAAGQRTCISCRKGGDKNEFIRITRTPDGNVTIDNSSKKIFGRSAYICKNMSCILKAEKENRIFRALKTKIEPDIYDLIKELAE